MKRWSKYTGMVLGGMMVLLGTACGSREPEEEVSATPKLQIYVYTPEHPVVTRADEGTVMPTGDEGKVNSLHIWVFEHDTGASVGYLNPSGNDLQNGGTYLMEVSDAFAKTKPAVDVFVMANVTDDNCGSCGLDLTTWERANLTRAQLEEALIGEAYFGLNSLQTSVPSDGLPMSGVLKGKTLGGEAPVLSAGTVTVVRTVSKMRFIFTRAQADNKEVKINKITLDDGMIPNEEYLFLSSAYQERASRVKTTGVDQVDYNMGEGGHTTLATPFANGFTVPQSSDPGIYVYTGGQQNGQDYEDLINDGLKAHTVEGVEVAAELAEVGPFYLRESDRHITGTISYQIGTDPETSKSFVMAAPGDFARNHTWIIYAYFAGNDKLEILTVTILPWVDDDADSHSIHNW